MRKGEAYSSQKDCCHGKGGHCCQCAIVDSLHIFRYVEVCCEGRRGLSGHDFGRVPLVADEVHQSFQFALSTWCFYTARAVCLRTIALDPAVNIVCPCLWLSLLMLFWERWGHAWHICSLEGSGTVLMVMKWFYEKPSISESNMKAVCRRCWSTRSVPTCFAQLPPVVCLNSCYIAPPHPPTNLYLSSTCSTPQPDANASTSSTSAIIIIEQIVLNRPSPCIYHSHSAPSTIPNYSVRNGQSQRHRPSSISEFRPGTSRSGSVHQ